MTVVAIVVAAGSGTRAGGDVPKQYRLIGGRPIIWWALKAFCDHPKITTIRAIIGAEHQSLYLQAVGELPVGSPIIGGPTRQASCRLGIEAFSAHAPDRILIHDAARPFVTADLIDSVIAALDRHPGAIPCLPVGDTLKRADKGVVSGTVDRAGLWAAQTPQGFTYDIIRAAHQRAVNSGETALTDDAAVAELAGHRIAIVPGTRGNRKLTTSEDIDEADRMINKNRLESLPDIRVGQGIDVHRFAPGHSVILLGVEIPHHAKLEGHSDADVAMHALTDAILGAIGDTDIGTHFPPSDPQWRGADSRLFLEHARRLVSARGGMIAHVDVTILAEAPRIAPHILAMKKIVATILEVETSRIAIKATTTETLGFVGRGEGIVASATATIRLPAGETWR